jgi:hypothetical protein
MLENEQKNIKQLYFAQLFKLQPPTSQEIQYISGFNQSFMASCANLQFGLKNMSNVFFQAVEDRLQH